MYQEYEGRDLSGTVLRIVKSSIYDGNGLRTVVFMKGCPLRCKWCSTPEGINAKIETTKDGKLTYGNRMTVEEVMAEVRKDSPFYFHSGGGMTVSGGEMLFQAEFVAALVKQACKEGINTAVETSFYSSWEKIEPILACLNTAFVDLKVMDEARHRAFTGVDNEIILSNIKKAGNLDLPNFKLIIRRPLVPGVNDSEAELVALGQFLEALPAVQHLQLLPYHRYGTDTYRKLGIDYGLDNVETPSEQHMKWCQRITNNYVKTII
ncbi:glycyl-radical enzyme activating protein [Agrilactobacillus yilanensis]|uniref:Glycyl-radical enzyme activating protein n=1 Tax=Agrilactobacillus yilanensis TaxID=2485997 RepID=A0ABW4J5Z9_9LACO|nr:glycyl-radical enzyme activating protein [Agrilactobacillus yilanensis]